MPSKRHPGIGYPSGNATVFHSRVLAFYGKLTPKHSITHLHALTTLAQSG